MTNYNPFPESPEKQHLRRLHLNTLSKYGKKVGRGLLYFGLPSAQMHDVDLWKDVLSHITAIERDRDVALLMYRTAQRIGLRNKMVLLEKDLVDVCHLLAMTDEDVGAHLANMSLPEQRDFLIVRTKEHDVINLDLCGGFLYPRKPSNKSPTSANVDVLSNLIAYQARLRTAFFLVLTFHLRDTGKDDYDTFIRSTLKAVPASKGISEVKDFYLAPIIKGQPPNLRRLRFCVPAYLSLISHQDFWITSQGSWTYKTFYHTVLFFEPRKGKSVLGKWPPIDELKDLLKAPMHRLTHEGDTVNSSELNAPFLS